MLDIAAIRAQFPILTAPTAGQPLIYLDSAASTQQPISVMAAIADYHRGHHANIHRGVYRLSRTATRLHEAARERVAQFLNAAEPVECLFTRGATESINLVAATWGRANLQPGDEILISTLEHHSNIVPWQLIAATTGAQIRVIPINDAGGWIATLIATSSHRARDWSPSIRFPMRLAPSIRLPNSSPKRTRSGR